MLLTDQQRLAGRFAQAVATFDVDALREVCTDDVTWTFPGTSPVAGQHHGAEGVLAAERTLHANGLDAGLPTLLHGPGSLIALMAETGDRDGHHVEVTMALHVQERDGRICALTTHLSDIAAFDEYLAAVATR